MMMQFSIKLATKFFIKSLNLFSIINVQLYWEPSQECQHKNFAKKYAWNTSTIDLDSGKCASFIKILNIKNLVTYSIKYQLAIRILRRKIQIKLFIFTRNILFFHPLFLNGTIYIQSWKCYQSWCFLKKFYWKLLDHLQVIFLNVFTKSDSS